VLPVIWAAFAVSSVGGFITLAAYWLDVQDRPDLTFRGRVGWSLAVFLFPITIPAYAFFGGPGWPRALKVAAFLPAVGVALFFGFFFRLFTQASA
jgi:hypothetical protein